MGAGERTARPFNRRILLPLLCGEHVWRWQVVSYSSLFLLAALLVTLTLTRGFSPPVALFVLLLFCGFPSLKFWIKTPVLTDTFGMAVALLTVVLPWPWNLIICSVGAFGRETVPIFAAIYCWDPILLVGLIPIGIYAVVAPTGPDQMGRDEWLKHPVQTSQKFKKGKWTDAGLWITPWGAALVGCFFPSPQLVVALIVAYAQTLLATDTVRLYVWAAPVLLLHAAHVETHWILPLLMLHWVNPKRGEGY